MRSRLALLATVVACLFGVVTTPARAEIPTDPPAASPPAAGQDAVPGAHTVTLVTGDRIRVERAADGRRTATVVDSAPGTATYLTARQGQALYVVPDRAVALIAAGRLDRRLFDVAGLVSQGYDDQSTATLPVIVAGQPGFAAAAPAGARVARDLPSVGARAMEVAKDQARRFWEAVAPGGGHLGTLSAGVAHVWLDAQVRSSLDRSVAQIGGPAARARGLSGAGVAVAVLDTGIDTTHPDLAGQVVESANFTEEPDTTDRVGHGTHVASTVAGTGAASQGRFTGVAPGARLLGGKVLQLGFTDIGVPVGTGQESWVLAGMQWAVDHGARVVNLSLGGPSPDGNDPLSRAVDTLTARTGTLFVVSAGNSGFGQHYTVNSPAVADEALAVGSVDRDEQISAFSSLGPRLVDGAVKPEITAPGAGIVAARSSTGRVGLPVDQHYTALSGTSMAAPHVSGAAALLVQQHPDWHAAQLRAALVSTASFHAGSTVYEQGGGRVDLDRATAQTGVLADTATLNLGYVRAGAPPSAQRLDGSVGYRNPGRAPVTLTLAATAEHQSGEPAPPGTFTVTPATVTVPPGGTARVAVTADLTGRRPGAYSARVEATASDGIGLGTPAGFYKQGEEVDVTFRALDRHGRPAEADLLIHDVSNPDGLIFVSVPAGGSYTQRLVPGDYTVIGDVRTPDESGRFVAEHTVVADPQFEAAQPNRTVVLDARRARPVAARVPLDTDVRTFTVGMQVRRPELQFPIQDSILLASEGQFGSLHATGVSVLPFEPPTVGHGDLDAYWRLVAPRARAEVVTPRRLALDAELMDAAARIETTSTLGVTDVGTAADLDGTDLHGRIALVAETASRTYTEQARAAAGAGAAAVLISSALPGLFHGEADAPVPVLAIPRDDGDTLRALLRRGPVSVALSGSSRAPYLYDLAVRERDRLPRRLVYHAAHGHLARLPVTYHATASDPPQRIVASRAPDVGAPCGYCALGFTLDQDWRGAFARTEYVTPGVVWHESVLQASVVRWDARRAYRRGLTPVTWARAPVGPGVPIAAGVRSVRDGDTLRIFLAGYTDGEPANWHAASSLFGRSTELTRDGTALGPCTTFLTALRCDVDVPPEPATYTLTARFPAIVNSVAVPPSTTTWTFRSGRSGDAGHVGRAGAQALPLIDLDYRLPVSATNTAPAGSPVTLAVAARHQPGAPARPVDTLRVQVSYDDGATWQDVPVRARHGWFEASYRHPRLPDTSGRVALRVTAADPDGNAVTQEITRAYQLVG